MAASSIQEVFESLILWGCVSALVAIGIGCVLAWLSRLPLRVRKAAKRFGWPTVVVLGSMMVFAVIEGTPTNADKQHWQEQEEEEDANSVFGMPNHGVVHSGGSESSNPVIDDLTSSGEGNTSNDANGADSPPLPVPDSDEVILPFVQPLKNSDYASGVALARIGTNEVWDFSAPEGAEICSDWLEFGAARDWFKTCFTNEWFFDFGTKTVNALTIFSNGTVRPALTNTATFFSPLQANLGIVPVANWERLAARDIPSQFWQSLTPSNTFVTTWQNVLLNQQFDRPVSFQMEFEENGDVTFRYDLSRLTEDLVTNLVVGISNDGIGRVFNALTRDTTSLKWVHLDPARPYGHDPDGDGLTTEDEIFVYGTDPYCADTDRDGLTDGQEVNETSTDPLNAHAVDSRYPDGVALIIGDLYPFSYPEGSTNTILEHVFYTGTTNTPFAYPRSSEETAVLKVSVSGTGTGRLVVGDDVVPLIAPSQFKRSVDTTTPTNTLLLAVGKGERKEIWWEKPEGMEVALESSDFMIGRFNPWQGTCGWIGFPHTTANPPCIHDFVAEEKRLTLVHGEEFEGLRASWSSDEKGVAITNLPPISAELYGRFPKRKEKKIVYTLAHSDYICGETNYVQRLLFCPEQVEEQEDDGDDSVGSGGDSENEGEDTCDCGSFGLCSCCSGYECSCSSLGCRCNRYQAPSPEDDEDFEEVGDADEAFTNIVNGAYQPLSNVLYLYRKNSFSKYLNVPEGEVRRCCSCPEHWASNNVRKVVYSNRVAVHDSNGDDFKISNESCWVELFGLSPSHDFGDSTVAFLTNGVEQSRHDCTVLGVKFETEEGKLPLAEYNRLSSSFGFPMTVCINLDDAETLVLQTDILLMNGVVRLSIENATGAFQVWLPEGWDSEHDKYYAPELLLSSDGETERYFTIRQWRNIMRRYDAVAWPSTLKVKVLSGMQGHCDLKFEYATSNGTHSLHDYAQQRITSVNPPLRLDSNRDGAIDDCDAAGWFGYQPFYYWVNEDTIKGDYKDQIKDKSPNSSDLVVNGTFDLVNFFPVAVDLSKFIDAWNDSVQYTVRPDWNNANSFNFCFADVPWDRAGLIQTTNVTTLAGQVLSSASLTSLPETGYQFNYTDTLTQFSENSGLMICEAKSPYAALRIDIKIGDIQLYSYSVPMTILPVKEMYNWYNFRRLSGDNSGRRTEFHSLEGEDDSKVLIFLHGANVSSEEAEEWGDIIFKRLWLSGSRARFYNVDWRSNINGAANYHENASNAFVVASRIVNNIQDIRGEKILMAHSLGNMVVSSMIQDYGLEVSRYLMCNSAVPSEAYCPPDDVSIRVPQLVHPDWEEYPTNSWASNWHKLFRNDLNDDRKHLGWPGRFLNVIESVAANFYSQGDEVLELAADNDVGIFTGISDSVSHYAWHKQELFKGRGLGVGAGATDWSGWNIEENLLKMDKISVEKALNMTDADFKTNTVFYCYPSSMNATNINLLVRDAHLALGIPALTPAAGAISFGGNSMLDSMVNANENNLSGIERPNGWPERQTYPERWLHSDMKNVSFFFNFKFYQKVVEKGNLK